VQNYVIRRLLQSIPLLIGITLITFIIMQMAPGDPMSALMSPDIPPEVMEARRAQLGLDRPVHVQYLAWLTELLQGNLGYAIRSGRPVFEMIVERLPATFLLTVSSLVFAYVIAIPLGIISGLRQHSAVDYVLTFFAFLGISTPSFFLGIILVYVFAINLSLLPTSGHQTVGADLSGMAVYLDRLKYLVLPMLALGSRFLAQAIRFMRSSILDVLSQDYVRTARSKGLPERTVVYKHALRNAMLPVITLLGITLPLLFGGAVVIETVFAWPGIGRLGVNAILSREYPVLMGINLFIACMVLMGNLLADVLYAFVDPRIQYS